MGINDHAKKNGKKPAGNASGPRKAASGADYWRGFVRYTLTDEDKEIARQWAENSTPSTVFDFLQGAIETGHEFRLRWHDGQEAYNAILFGREVGGENHGLWLGTWHTDPLRAIAALAVLHRRFDGIWPDPDAPLVNLNDW